MDWLDSSVRDRRSKLKLLSQIRLKRDLNVGFPLSWGMPNCLISGNIKRGNIWARKSKSAPSPEEWHLLIVELVYIISTYYWHYFEPSKTRRVMEQTQALVHDYPSWFIVSMHPSLILPLQPVPCKVSKQASVVMHRGHDSKQISWKHQNQQVTWFYPTTDIFGRKISKSIERILLLKVPPALKHGDFGRQL